MSEFFTDQELLKAMENCATEPVHIPGLVQAFGCLVAIDIEANTITYASENTESIIGIPCDALLGLDPRDALGSEFVHSLRNAASQPYFDKVALPLGVLDIGDTPCDISAFASQGHYVVEFEPAAELVLGSNDNLRTLSFLMTQIQTCTDSQSLFELSTRVLAHFTGYDRVMVYKFDQDYNGEILAEVCPKQMDSLLGLRFPHWDIPRQARAIMQKLPVRFIQDIDAEPIVLRALDLSLPALDITLAACRGVSPVHMQYLRNLGVKATMTLSIVIDGQLWGMISFHHRLPRTPNPSLRRMLTSFVDVFSLKLKTLVQQQTLDMTSRLNAIKDDMLHSMSNDLAMDNALPRIGPAVLDVMDAQGIVMVIGTQIEEFGLVPGEAMLNQLIKHAQEATEDVVAFDCLAEAFPEFAQSNNRCAGAIVVVRGPTRAYLIFREEHAHSVNWAGNPDKTLEDVSGQVRLMPRGSFSTYLQEIKGRSKQWSEENISFAPHISALIGVAEQRMSMNTLDRQKSLMIDELNHRVRNILALVRSVSRQARRRYGTLNSYAKAIESRIQALAAAHNITSGTLISAVEIKRLIALEIDAYQSDDRIQITGPVRHLRADVAPVFSLIIHELATNAAKYGALSVPNGQVHISLEAVGDEFRVSWHEVNGPQVAVPMERGFGSTLIEQAVPHELGGRTNLDFDQNGVKADIFLPASIFEAKPTTSTELRPMEKLVVQDELMMFPIEQLPSGAALVLEDNFIIANDMCDLLREFGFEEVLPFSNMKDAMDYLDDAKPLFAVLDINLGRGLTSEPVALRLQSLGVPFFFATGYADRVRLGPEMENVLRLTKPVSTNDLYRSLKDIFDDII